LTGGERRSRCSFLYALSRPQAVGSLEQAPTVVAALAAAATRSCRPMRSVANTWRLNSARRTTVSESMKRKFRFGLQAGPVDSATGWRDMARKAEDLGYSTLLLGDHMGRGAAPLVAAMAAAAATTRLRLSTQV